MPKIFKNQLTGPTLAKSIKKKIHVYSISQHKERKKEHHGTGRKALLYKRIPDK